MARKKAKGHNHDKFMARALDELAAFDDFKADILPALGEMVKAGATAEDIYGKFQALAAARAVSIIAREVDSSKALAAIKDVLDRTGGKPKERQEVTHKYSQLKEEQLDSLLLTELQSLKEDEPLSH